MLTCCFAPRPGILLASTLAITTFASCGADAPPPPARSTASLRGSRAPRGERAALGGTTTSLGDSALEPAAVEASKAEDWGQAESLYRELARRQPRSATAKRGLGVALFHQQKNDQAIEALEESVRLADDAQTRLELAAAFGAVGRYPSALPHLRKAVQLAPTTPPAWTALANALVKVEKPESAADVLRESRKTCTACAKDDGWKAVSDATARAALVQADKQITAGDLPAARKSTAVALGLRPTLPEAQMTAGKLARAEGDKKAAADAFRKVVEQTADAASEPGAGARLELATLLLGDGNGAEAVKLAEQVVAAHGDDGAALDTLGRACDATQDTDCARKAYGRLVKLPAPPDDERAHGALEHARLRMKQLKSRHRR